MKKILLILITFLWPLLAFSAGMTTHMFITEEAIDRVEVPELKHLLDKNRDTVISGSVFPDFGGGLRKLPGQYEKGEKMYLSHLPEFVEAYLSHLEAKCAPPFAGECQNLVAHFMGTIAHNLEDNVYDELYQREVRRIDLEYGEKPRPGLDTSLDMILIVRHHRWKAVPEYYVPARDMVEVYSALGISVEKWQVRAGGRVHKLGLYGERLVARPMHDREVRLTPWAADNIYSAPGGVIYTSQVIARYWEAMWAVLHGREDSVPPVLRVHPEDGGEISPEGYLTVVFPRSVEKATVTADTFILKDPSGRLVPSEFRFREKRSDYFRVGSLVPLSPLAPGQVYSYVLFTDLKYITGKNLPAEVRGTVKVKE